MTFLSVLLVILFWEFTKHVTKHLVAAWRQGTQYKEEAQAAKAAYKQYLLRGQP